MKKHLFALFLCFIYTFLSTASIFAARSIVITSDKTSLINEEEMIITASVSGFREDEKIYLKGVFYTESGTNYFGYTKNSDLWIKNSESAMGQREVQIGAWDKSLVVKSDYSDSGFGGKGEYNFKLGFYYITSGGNLSSVNWSENILKINLEPPQPSPSNTPTPTTYQQQIKISSPTKFPTQIKTISTTTVPSLNLADNSTKSSNFDKIQSEIEKASIKPGLGVNDSDQKKEAKVLGVKDKKDFSFVWIVFGLVFLISGFGYFAFKYAKDKNIL